MSGERFEKSVSETWNASVSRAPASVDTMPPRLKIDMSAANSAPSMPGGQIFAASTRSGRKPTSPRADWMTSSPSEKRRSSRPQARFACETSASGARPMIADATDDQRMTLLSRASLKRPLYAATPTSPATDPAALARPRKSGSNPSPPASTLAVEKKKKALPQLGVACHRNRNAAGRRISGDSSASLSLPRTAPASRQAAPSALSDGGSRTVSATAVSSSGSNAVAPKQPRAPRTRIASPDRSAAPIAPT
mmetsp:Transcript_2775/g.8102  ORF Transcript_2775/g.8102 Transcript_2775/m.8102 type:complete len:251 (+) Transcript_2775:138-890(+)